METLAVVIAILIFGVLMYMLAALPGEIAKKNEHPYASAVKALGIIGFLFLGIGWLAALVWAYMLPEEHMRKLKEKRQGAKATESKTIRDIKYGNATQV